MDLLCAFCCRREAYLCLEGDVLDWREIFLDWRERSSRIFWREKRNGLEGGGADLVWMAMKATTWLPTSEATSLSTAVVHSSCQACELPDVLRKACMARRQTTCTYRDSSSESRFPTGSINWRRHTSVACLADVEPIQPCVSRVQTSYPYKVAFRPFKARIDGRQGKDT